MQRRLFTILIILGIITGLTVPMILNSIPTASASDNMHTVNTANIVDNADDENNADMGTTVDSVDDENSVDNADMGAGVDNDNNADNGFTVSEQMTAAPEGQDVVVHPWLDGDDASITNMRITRVSDGTAPFDKDDSRGNDSGDDNGVVRSFDRVTYMVSFNITPDSQLDYYTRVRVGFRVKLHNSNQEARIEPDLFNWADTTSGYTYKYDNNQDADGYQVFTVYRLFEPGNDGENVAPGTYELPFAVNVQAMTDGQEIAPVFEAFTVPTDDGAPSERVSSVKAEPVRVSSKPSFNIRLSSNTGLVTNGSVRAFDFTADTSKASTSSDGMHSEFGKRKGMLSGVKFELGIRQADSDKGIRGLEVPKKGEPLSFDVEVKNTVTKAGSKVPEPALADLQPYFWAVESRDSWQGVTDRNPAKQYWNPNDSSWNIAAARGGYPRATYNSGVYTVEEERLDDRTVFHLTVNDWDMDINKMPYMATTNWSSHCSKGDYMDNTCTEYIVGSITIARLFMFSPAMIGDTSITDYYGSDATWSQRVDITNMRVTANDGGTVTSQSITNDDTKTVNQYLSPKGSISNQIMFACSKPGKGSNSNGTSCSGWQANDASHGTDVMMKNETVRVSNRINFDNKNSNGLSPVLGVSLMKFDDKAFHVVDGAGLAYIGDNSDRERVNGLYDRSEGWGGYDVKYPSTMQYAVKPDGSGWIDDAEQGRTGVDGLVFYDSYDEAMSHGTIVGILVQTRGASPLDRNVFMFPSIELHVNDDTPIGYVAQTTNEVFTWNRNDLADISGLDPDDELSEWESWAGDQTPMNIYKQVKPTYDLNPGKSYKKAQYDATGYIGGDTSGSAYGDSVIIADESIGIGISTNQMDTNGSIGKSMYDLDKNQRYVDYLIVPTITSVTDNHGTTTARITVTLPKGITLMDGSSFYGGEYTENNQGQLPGTVEHGEPLAPAVSIDKNGTTTITYTIADAPVDGTVKPIHMTGIIGDTANPDNDVTNGSQFVATATIVTTGNKGKPLNGQNWQTEATSTITVSKTRAQQLSTRAQPLLVEVGQSIGFINKTTNPSVNDKDDVIMVNAKPMNGIAGSSFTGTLELSTVSLNGTGVGLDGAKAYYTTDPKIGQTADLTALNRGDIAKWNQATINADDTIELPTNTTVFAVLIPVLPAGASITSTVTYQLDNANNGALLVNRYSDLDNQVIAMSSIVNRSLNGVVFIDGDKDGKRSKNDEVLGGIPVMLINTATKQPITLLDGTTATTTTDENGRYEFNSIPAGTYAVLFQPSEPAQWNLFRTTIKHANGVDPTLDSDADPIGIPNNLTGTIINTVAFPALEDMTTSRFTSEHQDTGLIRIDTSPTMPVTGNSPTIIIMLIITSATLITGIIINNRRTRQ